MRAIVEETGHNSLRTATLSIQYRARWNAINQDKHLVIKYIVLLHMKDRTIADYPRQRTKLSALFLWLLTDVRRSPHVELLVNSTS